MEKRAISETSDDEMYANLMKEMRKIKEEETEQLEREKARKYTDDK